MKLGRALLLIALGLVAFAGTGFAIDARIGQLTDLITAETDGALVLGAPDGFDPRITGTEPREWQSVIALEALRDAVDTYPDGFFDQYPLNIQLSGKLAILGVDVGGTVQPDDWVLLASDYLMKGAGPTFFRRAFHHEFSSVLIRDDQLPEAAWKEHLPDGFAFPETDAERLAATQTYADDLTKFHEDGFVSDYGASSLENDWNTYAELLLDDPRGLAQLAAQYPTIAAKTRLIQSYYQGLHQGFGPLFQDAGL